MIGKSIVKSIFKDLFEHFVQLCVFVRALEKIKSSECKRVKRGKVGWNVCVFVLFSSSQGKNKKCKSTTFEVNC